MTRIWYRVNDLDAARAFYTGKLAFTETGADEGWVTFELLPGVTLAQVQWAPGGGVAATWTVAS